MCYVADRVTSIVRREAYSPRGRGAILFALEHGLLEWDDTISDIFYSTLNDGLIRTWCVGRYDHEELVIDTRARIFERGLAPQSVVAFITNLKKNVRTGLSPKEILLSQNVEVTPGAATLIYAGCTAREMESQILLVTGRLFNKAGIPFQVLDNEPCCGWPLYQLGDFFGAHDFSVRLAKAIRDTGAQEVVVLDGDCYRMLLTRTRRFGGQLDVIRISHVTQILAKWINADLLRIKKRLNLTVTYHDPCSLARYCEGIEEPRSILSAILARPLIEMFARGKHANCCGAGGLLTVHRPDIALEVARMRLEEAQETHCEFVATACPRCDLMLRKASEIHGGPTIVNIVHLVGQASGLEM